MTDSPGQPDQPPAQTPDWAAQLVTPAPVIARRRDLVTILLRAAAVVALGGSLIPLLSWLAEGISDRDLLDFWYYIDRISMFVALASLPWVFMLFAPRIARRIVPVSSGPTCPGCGFDLSGLTEPLCPECAMDLRPDPLGGRAPAAGSVGGPVWKAGLIVGFRAAAVLFLMTGIGDLLSWLWWIVQDPSSVWYVFLGFAETAQFLVVILSSLGPALLLWCLAPSLARLALRGLHKP